MYFRQLFSDWNLLARWKMFFNLYFSFPKTESCDEFEEFCIKFHLLLSNINHELPLCSIITGDFNGRCARCWQNDVTYLTGQITFQMKKLNLIIINLLGEIITNFFETKNSDHVHTLQIKAFPKWFLFQIHFVTILLWWHLRHKSEQFCSAQKSRAKQFRNTFCKMWTDGMEQRSGKSKSFPANSYISFSVQ